MKGSAVHFCTIGDKLKIFVSKPGRHEKSRKGSGLYPTRHSVASPQRRGIGKERKRGEDVPAAAYAGTDPEKLSASTCSRIQVQKAAMRATLTCSGGMTME